MLSVVGQQLHMQHTGPVTDSAPGNMSGKQICVADMLKSPCIHRWGDSFQRALYVDVSSQGYCMVVTDLQ